MTDQVYGKTDTSPQIDPSTKEPSYQINEIFGSIQGEGWFAGTTATFVRLQGCAVGCTWCLAPQTPITLSTGSQVKIEDVKLGASLMAFDEGTQKCVDTVVKAIHTHDTDQIWKISAPSLMSPVFTTADHVWMTNTGWRRTDALTKGSILLRTNTYEAYTRGYQSNNLSQISIAESAPSSSKGEQTVYDLTCEPHPTFFANNILSHNCDSKLTWYAGGVRMNLSQIKRTIEDLPRSEIIIITGGEPLQVDLDPLLRLLRGSFPTRTICLETSGASPFKGELRPNWVTLSPKFAAGWKVQDNVLGVAKELKYVVDETFSAKIALQHLADLRKLPLAVRGTGYIPSVQLMPEGCPPRSDMVRKAMDILIEYPHWRFSPRLQYVYSEIAKLEGENNQQRDIDEAKRRSAEYRKKRSIAVKTGS